MKLRRVLALKKLVSILAFSVLIVLFCLPAFARIISIPGVAFRDVESTTQGCVYNFGNNTCTSTADSFVPISFPDGATITKLSLSFRTNEFLSISLYRYHRDGVHRNTLASLLVDETGCLLWPGKSLTCSGSTSVINYAKIDNSTYSYVLYLTPVSSGEPVATYVIHSVRIEYLGGGATVVVPLF